jgi:O-antigen/teichoic acid export membrane protein
MSRLSKNISYNFIGQGLVLLLGFVTVKYVFRQLGEDALGILYFTLTMSVILCAVSEMGISYTTIREVSSHFHDEPDYVRDFIRTASLFYWSAYGLVAVLIYLTAPFIVADWIVLKTMEPAQAIQVLRILGIGALLLLPHSLYTSLFRGLERMEVNNVIDVITSGLQQVGTIAILAFGGDLFEVVVWLATCFGFCILMDIVVAARFISWTALLGRYSSKVIERTRQYALQMMSISFLAMLHTQADKILLSKLLPLSTLGYYGFAWGFLSKATLPTSAIAQAALPSFSAQFRRGDRSGMMAQYRRLHDLLCFGIAPLFAAILFSSSPLLTYLFNKEAAQMLLAPMAFLCLGYYMNGTLNVPYVFSLAVGKPEIAARSNFYALFIVLPVTWFLVYFYGLTGAAFSWVFYHLFAYSYSVPRVCLECLKTPVREWYAHLFRIFVLIGLTYGTAWTVLRWMDLDAPMPLAIAYVAASLGYLVGSFWLMGEELLGVFQRLPHLVKSGMARIYHP